MKGHTDHATINARRPLTPGMRETLEWIKRRTDRGSPADLPFWSECTKAEKNQIRGLRDRGYVHDENDALSITQAGRVAL